MRMRKIERNRSKIILSVALLLHFLLQSMEAVLVRVESFFLIISLSQYSEDAIRKTRFFRIVHDAGEYPAILLFPIIVIIISVIADYSFKDVLRINWMGFLVSLLSFMTTLPISLSEEVLDVTLYSHLFLWAYCQVIASLISLSICWLKSLWKESV